MGMEHLHAKLQKKSYKINFALNFIGTVGNVLKRSLSFISLWLDHRDLNLLILCDLEVVTFELLGIFIIIICLFAKQNYLFCCLLTVKFCDFAHEDYYEYQSDLLHAY